ncbi:MAG TPA: diguanylate cyclase [Polyangiaceae bacterium]|nr:diguanylate cyclase [Polyangiaceae bacterium]
MTPEHSRSLRWIVTLGAVLATALFSFLNGRRYVEQEALLGAAVRSRGSLVETLSLMKDAETGARGFLLTGNEAFLEPYDSARSDIRAALAEVTKLGDESSEQRAHASEVTRLARLKLDMLSRLIANKRSGPVIDPQSVAQLERGKTIMDSLRVEVAGMVTHADNVVARRRRDAAAASLHLELGLGGALGIALLLVLVVLSDARGEARRASELNEQLERDVDARKQAELRLREQTDLLESVLNNIGDAVLVVDRERRIVMVNPAARKIAPYSVGLHLSPEWSKQVETYLPDGQTRFPPERGPLTMALRDGVSSDSVEMMIRVPTGELRTFSLTARPISNDGVTVAAVGVFRDTTDIQRAAKQVLENEYRYRVLSEASFEAVAITRAGLIWDTNENFSRWLGYEPGELVGTQGVLLFAEEERERLLNLVIEDEVAYESRMLRRDGTTFPVEVRSRFATLRDERVRIAVVRDVTEKQRREAELMEKSQQLLMLSLRDELTGLYNRRGFVETAAHQLKSALRAGEPCAVFFADLNGMKQINDQLGHEMGDHALRAAASILTGVFRPSDVVARLGGDEFAIFKGECDQTYVPGVVDRIEHAVSEYNETSGSPYRLSISAGAAVCEPQDPRDLATLMQAADANMYEAKRSRHRRMSIRVRSSS